jgi:hypothetical protein
VGCGQGGAAFYMPGEVVDGKGDGRPVVGF